MFCAASKTKFSIFPYRIGSAFILLHIHMTHNQLNVFKFIPATLTSLIEIWPFFWLEFPALLHELINQFWTVGWSLEAFSLLQFFESLLGEIAAQNRWLGVSKDLPHQNTIAPYVPLGCEFSVGNTLRRTPWYGSQINYS